MGKVLVYSSIPGSPDSGGPGPVYTLGRHRGGTVTLAVTMAEGRLEFSSEALLLSSPDWSNSLGLPDVVVTETFCEGMTVQLSVARNAGMFMLTGRTEPFRSFVSRELFEGTIVRRGNTNSSNVNLGYDKFACSIMETIVPIDSSAR